MIQRQIHLYLYFICLVFFFLQVSEQREAKTKCGSVAMIQTCQKYEVKIFRGKIKRE